MDQIVLHHYWRSSCSWRVRWALVYKRIPHNLIHVDILKHEHTSKQYLSMNPTGLVPIMEVDGHFFGESLAMMEWLEERYPRNPLLPVDPMSRLLVRQLTMTIVAGTQPLQNLNALNYVSPDEETRKSNARHFIRRGLQSYERLIEDCAATFSVGADLSFADLALIPQCYNALRQGIELEEFPQIAKIYQHCLTLDSCQKAAPESHKPSND